MNNFIFKNKTKVYFGKGGVKEYLGCMLEHYGDTVMLAYGCGSIKRNGVYDEVMGILNAKGNHGAGLAVIHPILYRHIYKSGAARFARWAQNAWGVIPKGSDEETASAGIDAMAAFIKEIGLPTSFAELGIPAGTDFRAVADSINITAGCCKKLTHDEIYDILCKCK